MDYTDQMRDPGEFAMNWDALVSSTLDQARQSQTLQEQPQPSELFPPVTTKFEIRRVSFEEFQLLAAES